MSLFTETLTQIRSSLESNPTTAHVTVTFRPVLQQIAKFYGTVLSDAEYAEFIRTDATTIKSIFHNIIDSVDAGISSVVITNTTSREMYNIEIKCDLNDVHLFTAVLGSYDNVK